MSPPQFFASFNGVIAPIGEVRPGDEETRPAPGKVLPWPGWLISAIFSLGKILDMKASLGMLVL